MQSSSPYRAVVSLVKATWLMLYREIIAVFSQFHIEHVTHTHCTLNIQFLDVLNLAIRKLTSGGFFISVFNQLDAQNFCFTISFISRLYMFRAHVLIIRRSKLNYTASGIITSIGVMIPEHMCSKHAEA